MSNHKKNKHKKKNNHYDPARRETHQTVKPWHRIGAMVYSNPVIACGDYSLSRRAPSASRSLLRKQYRIIPDF